MKNALLIALSLGIGLFPGICRGQINLQHLNESFGDSILPAYISQGPGGEFGGDTIQTLIPTPIEIDLEKCFFQSISIPESRQVMNSEKQYIMYEIETPQASQIAYKYELSVGNCTTWPQEGRMTILEDLKQELPLNTPRTVGDDLVATLNGNGLSGERAIIYCEDVGGGEMQDHLFRVSKICESEKDNPYRITPCFAGCQSSDTYFHENRKYYILCTSSNPFSCPLQASCIECDTSKNYYTLPNLITESLQFWGDKTIVQEGSFEYGIFDINNQKWENSYISIDADISGYASVYLYDESNPKESINELVGGNFYRNIPLQLPLKSNWKCQGIQLVLRHEKVMEGNIGITISSLAVAPYLPVPPPRPIEK